ncbi:hypothetical protein LXL04_038049 [Taraxacum kok-saghyz]
MCTCAKKILFSIYAKFLKKKSRFFGKTILRPGLERERVESFENSYIPENPRSLSISYISQTVISFKKPTSEPSKTYLSVFETKQKNVHICKKQFLHICKVFEKKNLLGTFENPYIPENPRTPPISYISQTVIPFKKPTSGLFKMYLKQNLKTYTYARIFFFLHICKLFEKKKLFFRNFFFATGLVFERFLAPLSRFFEKVNGLGVLGFLGIYEFSKDPNDAIRFSGTVRPVEPVEPLNQMNFPENNEFEDLETTENIYYNEFFTNPITGECDTESDECDENESDEEQINEVIVLTDNLYLHQPCQGDNIIIKRKSAAKNYLCILIASVESWPETTDFGFISISKPFFNSTECLLTLTASIYFVLGKSKHHRVLNKRLHM